MLLVLCLLGKIRHNRSVVAANNARQRLWEQAPAAAALARALAPALAQPVSEAVVAARAQTTAALATAAAGATAAAALAQAFAPPLAQSVAAAVFFVWGGRPGCGGGPGVDAPAAAEASPDQTCYGGRGVFARAVSRWRPVTVLLYRIPIT